MKKAIYFKFSQNLLKTDQPCSMKLSRDMTIKVLEQEISNHFSFQSKWSKKKRGNLKEVIAKNIY